MANNYYSMNDLLDYFIREYYLENDPCRRAALNKKIRKICENTPVYVCGKEMTLWDKAAPLQNGKKRRLYAFTDEERELLRAKLYDYLYEISEHKEILDQKREVQLSAEEEADRVNQANLEAMEECFGELKTGDEIPLSFYPSDDEFKKKKMEIMIEAVFLQFNNPIDNEQLLKDMEIVNYAQYADNHTAESIIAYKRLKSGTSYYTRKKKQNR
ncbi:MAG: hypothetical protein K2N34_15345 [Lachnospiraceae bacterium]|nr:hypothetical protein [Lachnospiraceae bacterium]